MVPGHRNNQISDEVFVKDACKIVDEGQSRDVILRILGALAVRIHCQEFVNFHRRLERLGKGKQNFTDLDFAAYGKQHREVRKLLEENLGYIADERVMALYGKRRHIYAHPEGLYHVDIFFDKLEFSHDVNFGSKPGSGRLELDYPTISLPDILLGKIQIHQINEKDIVDIITLIRSHQIGEVDEREILNAKYIAKVLADDWGFWYDANMNLRKVQEFADSYYKKGKLNLGELSDVVEKTSIIIQYIEKEPKTKRWHKRAKKGNKKTWWRLVETVNL